MAGNEQTPVETNELSTMEQVGQFLNQGISRRSFLGTVGVAGLGAVAFQFGCASSTTPTAGRQVFAPQALGMVVADNNKCVGCRRCEAACVAFNDEPGLPAGTTKTQPSISNVKVNRNLLYGPVYLGATAIGQTGQGLFGNFKSTPDTCRQCAHPVACMLVCPHGAIQVDSTVVAVSPNSYTVAANPVNPGGLTGGPASNVNANKAATTATIAYPGFVSDIVDASGNPIIDGFSEGPGQSTGACGYQTGPMGFTGSIPSTSASTATVTLPNAAYPQANFKFSNWSDGNPLNARVVNYDICVGCGLCVEACPWAMPALDGPVRGATTKSHKCHLCGGSPECVAACPSGALQYVPWENRETTVDQRQANDIPYAADVIDTCSQCH